MRYVVLTILYATLMGSATGRDPAKPWVAPGIALPAPQKVKVGRGYVKVAAECAGTVSFDAEADFAEEGVEWQWELLDPKTILVAIPASAGQVRVSAVGLVDGKLTRFVRTLIEVEAGKVTPTPRPPPAPPGPVGPPSPPAGTLHAYAVVDTDMGGVYPALVTGREFRAGVAALGVRLHVLPATSKAVATQGLTKFVADAGGAPALVLVDEGGKVHLAARLPATAPEALLLLKSKVAP